MLDAETIRMYCLQKENVTEGFPFGGDVLVFKVNGKMFCLLALSKHPLTFNVKCDPEKAEELRTEFDAVLPGYHMNKKYWNTIMVDGSIANKLMYGFIDSSYDLVANQKKKKS